MTDPKSEQNATASTKTYVIACKLPNGLYCEMGKLGDDNYRRVQLKGSNDPFAVAGFGITQGVDAAFWDVWAKKNGRLDFMRKGQVYAAANLADAEAYAREHGLLKTGLEALDPLKKVVDPNTGAVLVEVDSNHFAQARKDVATAGQAARNR
jgi:hypothetical protein